ncbi:MAG: hotdog domain-containing protein, partial [Steroidobacteraceae bacterium]
VYYANYLRFLERARTEWLRAQGIPQWTLARERGLLFTVAGLEIRYRQPARLDDELIVTCEPARTGGASLSFAQRIYRRAQGGAAEGGRTEGRGAEDGGAEVGGSLAERDLLAAADVRVACIDARTLKPQRLPDFMVDVLTAP